uniref:NR LBD domain-containing protein n=1 Tax=Panagrolaimus sp. JU765 TaxID=591449 RepID=A0AC34PW75_9BILA
MTPFQQLQYAFAQFRGEVCPSEPVEPVEVFDKLSSYPFYEQYAKKVAEMLMACDPFVHLPFEDKWRLFRHAWPLVNHLERQFSSCELFGYNLEDQRMLMTKDVAIDFGRSQFVVDGMDPQKLQEYMKFCFPLKQGMTEMIRTPMKQLQLTEFEVCYMVGLVVFSVTEVRGLSEETRIIGEQIADQFSSELHNYYTYELKLKNYAARHAKLIRLISCAQQLNHTVKDHMVMAKIFDLFITDIYESELYE